MSKIKPMLCEIAGESAITDIPGVIWERKFDGARLLSRVSGSKVDLAARSGTDKNDQFPELMDIHTKQPCILDGEVVVYDDNGRSVFKGIQQRINTGASLAKVRAQSNPVTFEVFDILEVDDISIRSFPLSSRKAVLKELVIPDERVHLSEYVQDGHTLLAEAYAANLEGIVGKRLNSHYQEGVRGWLKVKLWIDGVFIVHGWTEGTGWRKSTFGALVLADPITGEYVGSVGTGYTSTTPSGDEIPQASLSHSLHTVMERFVPGQCPWEKEPEKATWVQPFTIKVRYLEKTEDGRLRFPAFKGFA